MCLDMSRDIHHRGRGSGIITLRPLLVWKALEPKKQNRWQRLLSQKVYKSPFVGMRYKLNREYESKLDVRWHDRVVEAGLHAYAGNQEVVLRKHWHDGCVFLPAIISGGSELFVSLPLYYYDSIEDAVCETVSDSLTVYETIEDALEAHPNAIEAKFSELHKQYATGTNNEYE